MTWLLHICDMTCSYVWHSVLSWDVKWDMFRSYGWHNFFNCMTRLFQMYDMAFSYVWHDFFICMTWLVHTCDMTSWSELKWKMRHVSFVCVTWLLHMCDVTSSYVWHDFVMCVTKLLHMCDMTSWDEKCFFQSPRMGHDSFICVAWLFHMCGLIFVWFFYMRLALARTPASKRYREHIYMHGYVNIDPYICISTYIHIFIYIHTHTYICICTHIQYIYIHIQGTRILRPCSHVFTRVSWLIHLWDATSYHVWHTSFVSRSHATCTCNKTLFAGRHCSLTGKSGSFRERHNFLENRDIFKISGFHRTLFPERDRQKKRKRQADKEKETCRQGERDRQTKRKRQVDKEKETCRKRERDKEKETCRQRALGHTLYEANAWSRGGASTTYKLELILRKDYFVAGK